MSEGTFSDIAAHIRRRSVVISSVIYVETEKLFKKIPFHNNPEITNGNFFIISEPWLLFFFISSWYLPRNLIRESPKLKA